MKVNLTAPAKPAVEPYCEHVAVMAAEVLPSLYRFAAGKRDEMSRAFLERSLWELEHACRVAREKLND